MICISINYFLLKLKTKKYEVVKNISKTKKDLIILNFLTFVEKIDNIPLKNLTKKFPLSPDRKIKKNLIKLKTNSKLNFY